MNNALAGNWRSSVIGFAAGALAYLAQLGPNLPKTKQEWIQAALAAALAGLGIVAKDSATGSQVK